MVNVRLTVSSQNKDTIWPLKHLYLLTQLYALAYSTYPYQVITVSFLDFLLAKATEFSQREDLQYAS